MKRILSVIMLVALLLIVTGCKEESAEPSQSKPEWQETIPSDTTQATNTVILQQPMTAVSVPAVTETATAEDGTLIFSYTYQDMALTLPDPDVANKVIIDFLNRVDKTRETADSLLSAARDAYISSENWAPFFYHVTYNPTRIDPGVLSLFGTNITFRNGMHPDRSYIAANYDLITGDVLTLSSILAENASTDDICQLVLDELNAKRDSLNLYSGHETTVSDRFRKDASQDWFFSQTGLCFYFSPYEIAPYSTGLITVEIPYAKLTNLLLDNYFPDEKDSTGGTVTAQYLKDADMSRFSQIAEVTIDKNAEMTLLYTDGSVRDLRIEVGTWDNDANTFSPSYTAFAAYSLTPGDAVMVAGFPILRITYSSADETAVAYLMHDASSDSLLEYEN